MVATVPRVHVDTSVEEVLRALRGWLYDCADAGFVSDTVGQMVGIVRIDELSGSQADCIGDILQEEHDVVRPGDDQEAIVSQII